MRGIPFRYSRLCAVSEILELEGPVIIVTDNNCLTDGRGFG